MDFSRVITEAWSRRGLLACSLLPLAGLFSLLSALRRLLYRLGLLKSVRLPRPVIVVGNITVGGAGKTPLTLYLATELAARGYRPGIVSRGYGGRASEARAVRQVGAEDEAAEVGDEPLLMARRGICPVWIGRDRAAAGAALLTAHPDCDVILCDDGLQHYRLARDVEIVVMDGRGAGNGWLLPSGPLREPLCRLRSVDALVMNGGGAAPALGVPVFAMSLSGNVFHKLTDPGCTRQARDFAGFRLHALAGIGHPQRFFDHLAALGLNAQCHAFPDHHPYALSDIKNIFGVEVLFMTEKDGVKCAALAPAFAPVDAWILRVEAEPDPALMQHILEKLNGRPPA